MASDAQASRPMDVERERQTRLLKRYKRIIELSGYLNTVLKEALLLEAVLEAAQEVTDSTSSSILLVDQRSGDLYFEAAMGAKKEEIQRFVVPMDNSIAGWVVRHGEPVLIDDARQDERHFQRSDKD